MASFILQHLFYFLIRSGLYQFFLMRILEATCTPQGVWHILIFCQLIVPKVSFPRSNCRTRWNWFYKRLVLRAVHNLCAPPFPLVVKSRKYVFRIILLFFFIYFITAGMKYHVYYTIVLTYSLSVVHMKIPLQTYSG